MSKPRRKDSPQSPLSLTPAERRVLQFLPTHLTLAAIGERLGSRRSTVNKHVDHIYKKLGVCTRAEAVERARQAGLLADPDR